MADSGSRRDSWGNQMGDYSEYHCNNSQSLVVPTPFLSPEQVSKEQSYLSKRRNHECGHLSYKGKWKNFWDGWWHPWGMGKFLNSCSEYLLFAYPIQNLAVCLPHSLSKCCSTWCAEMLLVPHGNPFTSPVHTSPSCGLLAANHQHLQLSGSFALITRAYLRMLKGSTTSPFQTAPANDWLMWGSNSVAPLPLAVQPLWCSLCSGFP